MSDQIQVLIRSDKEHGTRASRRLRTQGHVPVVLYGHGEKCVSLKAKATEIVGVIRLGHKLVELKGDLNEKALLKSVQWDVLGLEVVHIDLTRVSAGERVITTIAVELRGDAPGVRAGGIIKHVLHEVDIEAPVTAIPDRIIANLKDLQLDGEILASGLEIPEGVKLVTKGELVVVSCSKPADVTEELTPTGPAEPELIRKEKPVEDAEA